LFAERKIALLMKSVESVTDIFFLDISLISDTMPISYFCIETML
jgi:hypothetical protein